MLDLSGSLLAWNTMQTVLVICVLVIVGAYYWYRSKQT